MLLTDRASRERSKARTCAINETICLRLAILFVRILQWKSEYFVRILLSEEKFEDLVKLLFLYALACVEDKSSFSP